MTKSFKIVISLLPALFLISCSSENDNSEPQIVQEQLDALVGTWTLVTYEVNPPQDVNKDGTASANLLDELDCLSGTLVLTDKLRWNRTMVRVIAAPITGGAFGIACGSTSSDSGDWLFLDNQLLLEKGAEGTFAISGTTLTQTVGDDLPGVRKMVYQKL